MNDKASAVPTPAEVDQAEDDDDHKVVDTPEARSAKQAVVKDVINSLSGLTLQATDKEFEGFSNLLLALIQSLFGPSHDDFSSLILSLVDAVSHSGERTTSPTLPARYTAISTIFNSLPTPPAATVSPASSLRLAVIVKLVTYAANNDDFAVISPALAHLEPWLVQWGFGLGTHGEEEGNAAVGQVVDALLSKGQAEQARSVLLAHLAAGSAVEGQAKTPSASAAKLASQLISITLSIPSVFDLTSLASIPAVAAPSVPALSKLLSIFQSGDVAAFTEFAKAEGSVLAEQKLEVDQLEHKLRLLALAEVCSTRVGQSVSYGEVAEALKLGAVNDDGEEVETWVIDGKHSAPTAATSPRSLVLTRFFCYLAAIRASLISGRLSQPQLSFHVTRATPRSFTPAHWAQLQTRLEGWRSSIDGILDSVNKGLQIDGGAAGHELGRREEPAQIEASA